MQFDHEGAGDAPWFLRDGGAAGALMRAADWRSTPLGDPIVWPPGLATLVGVMLGSAQPMFVAWGAKRNWLYNDAYAPMLGSKHPMAMGKPAIEVWPEIIESLNPMFETVFAGGAVQMDDIALTLNRKGFPEEAHFSFSYTAVRVSDGAVEGLFCACAETTAKVEGERRAALAARELALSEERYRTLFDSMAEGFGVLEAVRRPGAPNDFLFLAANPAFAAITGVTGVVGHTVQEMFPGEPQEWFDIYDKVIDTGQPIRFERGLKSPEKLLDIYAHRLADDGVGGRACVAVVFNDVTQRKRAQDERDRVSDRLLALNADLEREIADRARERGVLWSITSDLMAVLDSQGLFESANPAWQDVLGWTGQQLARTPAFDLMHPEDVEAAREAYGRLVAGEALKPFVNRYRDINGQYRWISWSAVPEADKFYCSGRDVTAELEAREALEATQDALRQAQKMEAIGQLTGGIAHDFNNLLTSIGAGLEILERRVAQGKIDGLERYIGAARGSAKRAASLTQRLLAFSRRQTLDPKPVNVDLLIASMEELLSHSAGPNVQLEVVKSPGLWTTKIDAPQLESALLNLCINGRDAMAPGGGLLRVESTNVTLEDRPARELGLTPGHYVSVRVRDTGIGMDAKVRGRAFEPFFTTKPVGEGTGLGLSMVYGFVRQSNGQVAIESTVGQGTTMTLYFPRHEGPAALNAAMPPIEVAPGAGEVVMVVEDEPTIRDFLIEDLRECGYRTLEAGDGAAALALLESISQVDLLVTDVGLPGGTNGRQLADAARVARPHLKVMFITGFADRAAVGNGQLDAGMEVLTKPFDMTVFATRVRSMLGR